MIHKSRPKIVCKRGWFKDGKHTQFLAKVLVVFPFREILERLYWPRATTVYYYSKGVL